MSALSDCRPMRPKPLMPTRTAIGRDLLWSCCWIARERPVRVRRTWPRARSRGCRVSQRDRPACPGQGRCDERHRADQTDVIAQLRRHDAHAPCLDPECRGRDRSRAGPRRRSPQAIAMPPPTTMRSGSKTSTMETIAAAKARTARSMMATAAGSPARRPRPRGSPPGPRGRAPPRWRASPGASTPAGERLAARRAMPCRWSSRSRWPAPPQPQSGPSVRHGQVAQLARHAVGPGEEPTVGDDGAADARGDGEVDDVA